MIKCKEIHITGRVQGVGYRYSTLHKALELDVKGYVKNNYDSSVSIVAEGEEEKLNKLVIWCHVGPPRAIVEKVTVHDIAVQHHNSFRIR